jgi:hypothetical protein
MRKGHAHQDVALNGLRAAAEGVAATWPAGQRDKIFTLMYSSNYLASSVGPVVAAVLFYFRGNSW